MELQDVIDQSDISYKVGDKVKYVTATGIEREGIIVQMNLILSSVYKFADGMIEYLVEYDETCYPDKVFEENII